MQTANDQFVTELKKILTLEKRERADNLGAGVSESFDDYRHRVGIIRGIDIALDFAETLSSKLNQR